MSSPQEKTKASQFRIDVDDEHCLNLELEASSGVWHVLGKHEEKKTETKEEEDIEVKASSRSCEREMLENNFSV